MISHTGVREFLKIISLSLGLIFIHVLTGSKFSFFSNEAKFVSAFFIPAGLGVSTIIFFGRRYLPVIFVAKLILGYTQDVQPTFNIVNGLATMLEAFIGYFLYHSFKHQILDFFEHQAHFVLYSLVAFLAPVFSSLISITYLFSQGSIPEESYLSYFRSIYLGEVLGILIFLPFFISLKIEKQRLFDYLSVFIALFLTYVFVDQDLTAYFPVLFLTILLPAVFGSPIGIYSSVCMTSVALNLFSIEKAGFFTMETFVENLTLMQFYLFALVLSALALDGYKRTNLLKTALAPLIILWSLTGFIYYHFQKDTEEKNIESMNELITDYNRHLVDKISFYESSIKGGAGLINSSTEVTDDEWGQYINAIGIVNEKEGILGAGIIYPKNVKRKSYITTYPDNLNKLKTFERLVDRPDLKLYFEKSFYQSRPVLTPALKFELFSGRELLTSFLIKTVKNNDQLIAWVIFPMDMQSFFKSASISSGYFDRIDIDIFNGNQKEIDQLIYSQVVDEKIRRQSSANTFNTSLTLIEQKFTINWNQSLRYLAHSSSTSTIIIFLGAIFSIIVTSFILNLKLLTEKANRLAEKKTLDFRESEERFKALFENSGDAIILFNNTEIVDCNPQSLVLFGKKLKKELTKIPIMHFFSLRSTDGTNDKDLFLKKFQEVKSKKIERFECYFLRDSHPFFAEIHLHYIEVSDKYIYQAVIRDISERKKFEETLKKSKELAEEVALAKSNFLSTMSHEIRTPLNGIIGMVNIILEENSNLEIREDLDTIKHTADNLLHIVNEVLDYTKIESGNIVLEKQSFNFRNFCENLFKIHRPKALEKKINIDFVIDANVPEFLVGDEFRNAQILNNLLSNAIKFTSYGNVLLTIRKLGSDLNTCTLEFQVSDTGIGIDKEKHEIIFKDFTQAESDHARRFGGTSLGLAISKKLIEIQNGRIDISSVPKVGATIIYTIEFRVDPKQTVATSTSPTLPLDQSTSNSFNGQRVLLVEDNQVNIIVTKKFLEKWGLKVDVAINGLEAVNNVRASNYDLILMDLHMPIMDGFEATKVIREFNKETPIIGLSADVMTESISSLKSMGMNDFVSKPFRPIDFFNRLKSFIK